MSPWIHLAVKEFWLPFHYRKSGCPGGRDFVWLTTFMTLLLTLMLLLLASREGLLNRFVDVLLGNVPGHGVPIAVTNNMLSKGGLNAIDTAVLAEIRHLEERMPGLQIHPYRTLEANLYPLFRLPGDDIWKNTREDGSAFGPDFNGWAVAADNPLWQEYRPSTNLPLDIVLSRTLFEAYFDYEAYRQALQGHVPDIRLQELPERLSENSPLEHLWLQVTIGFRKEFVPFRIHWVTRFPVIDKLAYIFPLSTYHALKAAHELTELRYFPEANGDRGERIKQIMVASDSVIETEFVTQLNGDVVDYRGDILITLKHPLPTARVAAYAAQYRIKYDVVETYAGDSLSFDNNLMTIPCGRLSDDMLRDLAFSCDRDGRQPVDVDVTAKGRGFHHALVYVPDRTVLATAAEELETVNKCALSIHPSYQDALNRFGFLSAMIDALEKPYLLFLITFLLAFLGIQIATLIDHHRHRYGVFLAKGMEWWQIYAMLWLQILMASGLGMAVALALITAARLFLHTAIGSVSMMYADTLSIGDLNVLPLTQSDYVVVAAVVVGLALCLATLLLYFLPLRRHTHPAALL